MRAIASLLLVLYTSHITFAGFISDWQAASGLTPDQIAVPYALQDSAVSNPSLVGGVLTLATSTNAENLSYNQVGSILDTSLPFYIEARVRRVSGSTSSTAREPISISFTTASGIGNTLFIGNDEVFFNTANLVSGPRVAVDTNDAFHTYRVNYDGNSNFTLSQDGTEILSGSTFSSLADFGPQMRVSWGEGSSLASGSSEWIFVQHNALSVNAVPEPTMLGAIAAAVILGRFAWRKKYTSSSIKPCS